MTRWRLIDPGPLPAWRQMALDSVMIRARDRNEIPDTLRFMEFSPHTVLVGYHQAVDLEVERARCQALNVEINRRVTGGGAIYMDSRQLGWEICVGQDSGRLTDSDQVYRQLSEVVVEALASFGIPAAFRPVNDVEVNGRKISGTGGTRFGDALIYQGTLLVEFDVDLMIEVLKLPIEKLNDKQVASFRERIVTMAELLGHVPPMAQVKEAVVKALEKVLNVTVSRDILTPSEEAAWHAEEETFRRDAWIDRRIPPDDYQYVVREASLKTPGGLLRARLLVDSKARRIHRAFLTGDFFVQPDRAPMDLEAQLKDAPWDLDRIRAIIRDHYTSSVQYLGVIPKDWENLLEKTLSAPEEEERAWP